MVDPITLALTKLASTLAEDAVSGFIGNRTDFFVLKGYNKVKELVGIRGKDNPENHDLLKALRRSMLIATDMVRLQMKDADEQKAFRKELKPWIMDQLRKVPDIDSWANWSNPAINELELFFITDPKQDEQRVRLNTAMTTSWQNYLAAELPVSMPDEFISKLSNGWYHDGQLITWPDAVIVLTIETFRNAKTDLGQRAAKAFEHTFLAELKLKLIDIIELLTTQIESAAVIMQLGLTVESQQKTIASQQETIARVTEQNKITLKSQLWHIRKELTALGFKYDECLQQADTLIQVDPLSAQIKFMESATVLNQIVKLYETSRSFLPVEKVLIGDNLLLAAKKEGASDQLTNLIRLIQFFDQIVNASLENQ